MFGSSSVRFATLCLSLGFAASAGGASKAPVPTDFACTQFQRVTCSQASQLEANFKASASLRLGLSGGRAANPQKDLVVLQGSWQMGIQCAKAADAQHAKVVSGHTKGMEAYGTLKPSFATIGEFTEKRNFPGAVKAAETCKKSADTAIGELGVCSAAFGSAQADERVALAVAKSCVKDIQKAQQSLKGFVANLYENNELKSKKGTILKSVHGDWQKFDQALGTMGREATIGLKSTVKSFGDIAVSLEVRADQQQMGGECNKTGELAVNEKTACEGSGNFAIRNMSSKDNAMPVPIKQQTESNETTAVRPTPTETGEPLPGSEETQVPKGRDSKQPVAAAEEPHHEPDSGVQGMPNPYANSNANPNAQAYANDSKLQQLEQDNAGLQEQLAKAKEALTAAGQQAAQQAAAGKENSDGGHEQAAAKPTEKDQPKPASSADSAALAKAKSKVDELEAKIKAKEDEIAKRKEEIDKTKVAFSQEDPNAAAPTTQTGNGNTTTVVATNPSNSGSSSNGQALASTGGTTKPDAPQAAVGRALVSTKTAPAKGSLSSDAVTFTAFKLDCNTGLGKCSKIPIACGSSLSAEDQTACDNEAAKREKNKKRALAGVENP